MDYNKIYNKLIDRARDRSKDSNVYYEKHHIIPKSLGGSNNKTNLCFLTLKEHFFAHLLLTKIYPKSIEMQFALWNMCNVNPKRAKEKRYVPCSRTYEQIRRNYMDICKGKDHPLFGRKQSREQVENARKGKYKTVYQYTLNGEYVKEWESAQHVSKELNIAASNISMCCNKKGPILSIKGYRWEYEKYENLPEMTRKRLIKSSYR
jgi:hypothetical protein